MWPKSLLVMLLVCVALYPGKTKADASIVLQDFEQIIFDFFEQYSNNTADDICKASVPEKIINKESFEKSPFYQQLNVAGHSKCEEKQCSTINYELGELREVKVKIDKRIAEEIEETYTYTTSTSNESEETTLVTDTSIGSGIETTESGHTTTKIGQETTERQETTESGQETTERQETTDSGQETTEFVHGIVESSKWENNNGTASKNGKKTTVIVVSTMAAVAATSAAAFYGVPWIKALLQSGSYRFPTTPGV